MKAAPDFVSQLSSELSLSAVSVSAVCSLLDEGNTIPFIARYRKEATNGLDEIQIRDIQERRLYLQEFHDRRETILQSIESQELLTDQLREKINQCTTKAEIEDLYLPFKPKRRTKATIAKEKGLEPLADRILAQPLDGKPYDEALIFVNAEKNVNTAEEALSGACDIVAEKTAENAVVRKIVRDEFSAAGLVVSKVAKGKENEVTKFQQYYDYKEAVSTIPSHRYLAIRRGEQEGVLEFHISIEEESTLSQILSFLQCNTRSPFGTYYEKSIQDSFKRLILPSVETDVRVDLKIKSDKAAVEVFADNLRNLLLAAPLGGKAVIGIDPGLRTGCKCAAVDETGKYLDTITLYLCQGDRALETAKSDFIRFLSKYPPYAIGVGNGTAGRETETFVKQLLKDHHLNDKILVVSVSEAGASVYSASDIAREEFPELDLTIRGAISIARRLQDPLAELVKVDPKAIGVGQYQHDVYQQLLQDKLNEVVESCVNHVGVELNTASAPLLSNVAGIGPSLAVKIVKHREGNGAFKSRKQLLQVPGLGAKTFEQAAGFLRLHKGEHPLDASAVHPERYALVERIASELSTPLINLISNMELIQQIDVKKYCSEGIGELTLRDIVEELKKPGRDPRATFEMPKFRDDVLTINDLKVGMKLEGIVTNVTAFGVFVDLGVHQDGLIHISELTNRFIKDPSEVVKVGTKITVEVLTVEVERKRISLTARIGEGPRVSSHRTLSAKTNQPKPFQKAKPAFGSNPFANL